MKCCGVDVEKMCNQFECNVQETDSGIKVEVTPKDKAKGSAFKALVKACREFCGCC